jgi:triacylglycerol lipase
MNPFHTENIRTRIRELGAKFDETILHATREVYRPTVVSSAKSESLHVAADIQYGPAERHRLDVFTEGCVNAPVLIYVHGGGFVAGDKQSDSNFYSNVGRYFASAGFMAITMNYRLAPQHAWPAGPQDIQRVVDWVIGNASRYGGNARNIGLFGQSAGATHVATYLFDPSFHEHASRSLRTAVLFSGMYDLSAAQMTAGSRSYFGDDVELYDERSPLRHVENSRVPLLLGTAELDPGELAAQTYALAQAISRRDGRSPSFAWLRGHNHVSTVHSLGSAQNDVGRRLTAFLSKGLKAGQPSM